MTILISEIVRTVASEWGKTPEDLISHSRRAEYTEPRQVAALIACRLGHGHSAVGRAMHRHPATIRFACTNLEAKLKKNRHLRRGVEQVMLDLLEGAWAMPDISMCINDDCPSKDKCYRFMATPSFSQTYSVFEVPEGKDRCESFMEIWEKKTAPAVSS